MAGTSIIEATLTWTGNAMRRGMQVEVDDCGVITQVGEGLGQADVRLSDRALLPGFINVHSHAFQRGLRGRGETFSGGAGSFWTWREAMFEIVSTMDESTMLDLSTRAFREMRAAGITTVGEFHYLHHDASCASFTMDRIVLEAARRAGIRIVLLNAFYRTGSINQPLEPAQRRFLTDGADAYWANMDALARGLNEHTQSLGVVAHSIRAAPIDDIAALHEQAERRGLVFHMHVEEQPREIERCLRAYGRTPMALLNERLTINPMFTAVHCTHTAEADMAEFISFGGNVCLCPLTEANLGDGLANLRWIRDKGGHVCLGTDSNARISMIEEMRWMEYGQRLATQSRGVWMDESGDVAPALLRSATCAGARALGLKAGRIEAGALADFTLIDLAAPSLDGWTDDTLLAALVFGGADDAIAGTCVGGVWSDGGSVVQG